MIATAKPIDPTELSLLAAILSNPDDDTPRLVYADWLEGQDTVSVKCGECRGQGWYVTDCSEEPYQAEACPECNGTGYTTDTSRRDRAEFIRVQCELARIIAAGTADPKKGIDLEGRQFKPPPDYDRWESLNRRERELIGYDFCRWADRFPKITGHYHRGFISFIVCAAEDWLQHCDVIYWHPTQTVECPECHGQPNDGDYAPPVSCRCGSTGRIPRPFVSTAQPLEQVTLSDIGGIPDILTFELPKQLLQLNEVARH